MKAETSQYVAVEIQVDRHGNAEVQVAAKKRPEERADASANETQLWAMIHALREELKVKDSIIAALRRGEGDTRKGTSPENLQSSRNAAGEARCSTGMSDSDDEIDPDVEELPAHYDGALTEDEVRSARLHVQRKASSAIVGAKPAASQEKTRQEARPRVTIAPFAQVEWCDVDQAAGKREWKGEMEGRAQAGHGAMDEEAKHYWQQDEIDPDEDGVGDSKGYARNAGLDRDRVERLDRRVHEQAAAEQMQAGDRVSSWLQHSVLVAELQIFNCYYLSRRLVHWDPRHAIDTHPTHTQHSHNGQLKTQQKARTMQERMQSRFAK